MTVSPTATGGGGRLASAGDDRTIRLWDANTQQCTGVLRGHDDYVRALAFDPTASYKLASGSVDKTIRLWDTNQKSCTSFLDGHQLSVNSVAFDPEGSGRLASASADGTVRLWNPNARTFLGSGKCVAELAELGARTSVNSVAFNPSRPGILASAGEDGQIRIWDVIAGKCISKMIGHDGAVRSIAFDPQGTGRLMSAGEDRSVRVGVLCPVALRLIPIVIPLGRRSLPSLGGSTKIRLFRTPCRPALLSDSCHSNRSTLIWIGIRCGTARRVCWIHLSAEAWVAGMSAETSKQHHAE